MYISICDDQESELQFLIHLLDRWQSERNHALRLKTFNSASAMLDAAEKEPFSLYILDVMMPGMDGLEAAREIRRFDEKADIVFLTSSPGFAYESYSVRALDYLLKPVRRDMLFPILDRLFLREQKPEEGLTLKCGSAWIRIPFSSLSYVEVNGKHLFFNLTDGSVREVYGTLREYEAALLSRPEFMQPHRSYIVNMLQAAEFSPSGIRTFSGKLLPVSRLSYPQLQKDYLKLLFSQRED
ncbi:MAG: response regulator transcription factor [Lachnospiraceae bacterium]|nr:response regulator transcription factor [Lachnospiraceae bacterium]